MILEISVVIRITIFCFVLILLTSCGDQRPHEPVLHIHTSVNQIGELWVRINNGKPQRLLQQAKGYRPLVSPTGNWLAVEVRLMSDLNIVRLFQRKGLQYVYANKNITGDAWKRASRREGIELKSLERTNAYVSGWGDEENVLQLELNAQAPGHKELFNTMVMIPLEQKP